MPIKAVKNPGHRGPRRSRPGAESAFPQARGLSGGLPEGRPDPARTGSAGISQV